MILFQSQRGRHFWSNIKLTKKRCDRQNWIYRFIDFSFTTRNIFLIFEHYSPLFSGGSNKDKWRLKILIWCEPEWEKIKLKRRFPIWLLAQIRFNLIRLVELLAFFSEKHHPCNVCNAQHFSRYQHENANFREWANGNFSSRYYSFVNFCSLAFPSKASKWSEN